MENTRYEQKSEICGQNLNKMKKIYPIIISSLLILASCGEKEKAQERPVVKVQTEIASAGNSYKAVPYVGNVEANSTTSASFATAGTIKRVYVEEGQRVGKGQLIAEIDATNLNTALRSSEAVLRQAQDAYERMKFLHDSNSLPEIQWVEAQSKLQQAQAAVDMAKRNLADARLTAPVSGTVGTQIAHAGETAMPGQPVVTILDINTVKVNISVPEKELAGINTNSPCTISVAALGGKQFTGHKIVKSVQSNPMTHTYEVSIDVANPAHDLLPGMVCDVTFASESRNVISVPVTAVMKGTGNQLYVWVNQGGVAKRRNVETGNAYGSRVEIISGLQDGDNVIVKGMQKLSEGSKVQAI